MTVSSTYGYRNRSIFEIKTLIDASVFLINNLILAIIFIFITLEEIDWVILSLSEIIKDLVVDKTSWNIKEIF